MQLWYIRKNKDMLAKIPIKQYIKVSEQHQVTQFQNMWGFYTMGYTQECYYWEYMVFLRKTLIILISQTLAALNNEVQILMAIIIFISNLIAVMIMKPIESQTSTNINIFSQLLNLMFLYLGMFYATGNEEWYMKNDVSNILFVILIFFPIIYFYYWFIQQIFLNCLIMIFLWNRKIFQLITLNLIDSNKFYRDHIHQEDSIQEDVNEFLEPEEETKQDNSDQAKESDFIDQKLGSCYLNKEREARKQEAMVKKIQNLLEEQTKTNDKIASMFKELNKREKLNTYL